MIGIFDSGAGGIAVTRELRSLLPRADIVFFRDRPGAPYGTKSKPELKELIAHDINTLLEVGADKILMACCTASTLYTDLDEKHRTVSTPIIAPTAKVAASITRCGKIGVIATNTTALSHAFSTELHKLDPTLTVYEWQAQPLVALVESGARDGRMSEGEFEIIKKTISDAIMSDIDTLILGCTHFPLIEKAISSLLPGVMIVSSAKEGARSMLCHNYGRGKLIYLENKRR